MRNTIITILFLISIFGAIFTAYDLIEQKHKETKAKIELLMYIDRYNSTNSLAVESAMQDSINKTLVDFLLNNYNK